MLYREIIAVCSQTHTKHINTLCGQNVELLNVKPGGTYRNHCVIKGSFTVSDSLHCVKCRAIDGGLDGQDVKAIDRPRSNFTH